MPHSYDELVAEFNAGLDEVCNNGEKPTHHAHLIKAAPDLLAALKALSPAFGEGLRSGLLTQAMVDQALAAIAKACPTN